MSTFILTIDTKALARQGRAHLWWLFTHVVLPLPGRLFGAILAVAVVQLLVLLSCDPAELLASALAPRRPGTESEPLLRRWGRRALAWALVLALEAPLLTPLLLEQPVLLAWSKLAIVSKLYRAACGWLLGDARAANLLSSRCYSAKLRHHDLSRLRGRRAGWRSVAFLGCFGGYAVLRREELLREHLWFAVTCAWILQLEAVHAYRRAMPRRSSPAQLWRLLWRVSYGPVHGAAGEPAEAGEECEQHGVCPVCLGNLCTPCRAYAAVPVLLLRQRCAASAYRRLPRGAAAGLSLARACGLGSYKNASAGVAQRISTLPCGHRFHVGCMDEVAGVRLQCPTCRASLGDSWADLRPEDRLSINVGSLLVVAFWVALRWAAR